ncbi:glucuronate isomerase [Bacillus sp. SL00103]
MMKQGMTEQMMALSSIGLISRFIGMLTDSRSFYPIQGMNISKTACDIIRDWVEKEKSLMTKSC